MADNENSWSMKSKKYRKSYLKTIQSLYGETITLGDDNKTPLDRKNMAKVKRSYPEATQQKALVRWAQIKGLLIISISNERKRSFWMAQEAKRMGLTSGVSDLFLVNPNSRYHGYWIEMKAPGKHPTVVQLEWLAKVKSLGYQSDWFDNWERAKESIEKYLVEI